MIRLIFGGFFMIISDKNKIVSKSTSNSKNKSSSEAEIKHEDRVTIDLSYIDGDSKVISYPREQLERTKKQMENVGFVTKRP